MASSSIQSSSSALMTLTSKYDVFVSFRGEDTRTNFTDHLFGALKRKGVVAFRDDTKLNKGESIAPGLLRAIEGSQVFIVVFSKNYASSTWCLRELEQIFDCVQRSGKCALPIFYDVDPSEVRKQSGSYEKAFAQHEERFKRDSEMLQRWRASLKQVANLSGWDVRDKPQYAEIEKIVEEIINILGHKVSSLPNDLVGMHSPVEELEKLLHIDSVDDVRVVGICGMGGIGKTTLATVLYGKISHQFDACCFLDDVSKICRKDGPIGAQKQVLYQTLREENHQICSLYNGANLMQSRLRHVRTLIILDNVDQVEQLEKLAMNRECLGAGSRIIVISRDEHILKEFGVDAVYKVPLLNKDNSLQLFCRKAFKHDNMMSNYEKLAYDVLNFANGLPLAIKVLGSFLFGRDVSEWRSALARLRESSNKDIMDVLRLSFDGLDEMEKEIFLDIACFFNNLSLEYVKNILECCGFHADIGLRVLIDRSLICISPGNIQMHGLLEELGKKIVRENSTENPRKWSRLWLEEDFYDVRLQNMEKNVEAIVWQYQLGERLDILMAESLSKMSHLRLLKLYMVNFSGSLSCLSNKLRYVFWGEYPFMNLPSSFQPNQLVELLLWHSSIKNLWEGKKYLPHLRTLDLRHSENLIKMPDFREMPNLEWLNLEGCVELMQLDPSIGVLEKLVYLNLKDCKNLISIPNDIFGLSSLKYLNISGCSKVFNNPRLLLHSQSTSSIVKWITWPFQSWYAGAHKDLASCVLPSLPSFSCLRELDISFCGLRQIPDAIGCLRWLESLNLGGNNFVTLPSLRKLSKLVYLNLQHCKQLESLPELPLPELPSPLTQDHIMFPTYAYSAEIAGLLVFNCPELGERECRSSIIFSWMIQFIKANQESSDRVWNMDIVIPGSEIPRWFSNQNVGTSISMDPSPIVHDNNCISVACCVIFSVADSIHWGEPPSMRLHFILNHNQTFVSLPVIINRDLVTVKTNHMWLFYFSRESLFDILGITKEIGFGGVGHIQMYTRVSDGDGMHVEVKNCGYHWVFKQDLQLLNSTMLHRENLFARKRKFLAIENEAQPQP